MSYQVDQVEVTPVDIAPERKKPGKIAGILAKIRGLFDASKAPLAQPQVIEVTDEVQSNEISIEESLNLLDEHSSADEFLELAEKLDWNIGFIYRALQRLDEVISIEQVLVIVKQSGWNTSILFATFEKLNGTLSFEQVLEVAQKSEENFLVIQEALRRLNEALSVEQFLEIVRYSNWNSTVLYAAFEEFHEDLTLEQILELAEKSNWNIDFVSESLKRLDVNISLHQVLELAEKSQWNSNVVYEALMKLSEQLSLEQFFELAEKLDWDYYVVLRALWRVGERFSFEQVIEVAEKSEWNTDVLYEALIRSDELLSFNQVFELVEKTEGNFLVIQEALQKLSEHLSFEQVVEIAEKLNWDSTIFSEAFKKFDGTLSFDQFLTMAVKLRWDNIVVYRVSQKLGGQLSFEQVMKIAQGSRWNSLVIQETLLKLDGSLSFKQILEIVNKSGWSGTVVSEAFKKLEGTLSFKQVFEVANKSSWNNSVVSEAFEKLEGTLSFKQVFEVANKSSWNNFAVFEALKKLEGALSFKQVLEIADKSDWNSVIAHEAFEKFDGALSFKQVFEVANKSGWNSFTVFEALKKLEETLSFDQFLEVAEKSKWNNDLVSKILTELPGHLSLKQFFELYEKSNQEYFIILAALRKVNEHLPIDSVIKIIKQNQISIFFAREIVSKFLDDALNTSVDYTELVSELTQKYPGVLLANLERFRVNDTMQLATTLIKNKDHELVIDHLSHFPQKDRAQIITLLMKEHRLEKHLLRQLLSYIDFIDEQTKNDLSSKLLSSSATAFYPELLENEIPRAVGQFGSFGKEEQLTKLAQLKEGRFYKSLLVLSKAYGYSAEQIGFTFQDILSEINILISNNNDKHLFDLISLAVLLFPERETELQNIRETFSTQNSSPTEEMKPREKFAQFEALKEIFEYYAMITLAGRYNIDLLPHSLTSRITDKINTLYEKIKEYIVIAVSSELRHSNDFESRMFGKYGNILYKFGTPEDIRVFFERAKFDFPKKSNYPGDYYGGPSWATIADFGAQFWADSAQTDLSTKITLLNLAVSLQHNSGYFFDKDDRIKIENQELTKLLDFEARGERTFESFLKYGLENNILSQKEYDEYVQLNNTLASATEQLPTRVDSNQIYLRQMVQEAKKQIEAIQNNPAIPFEIKMEAQAVFSKTEGFSRKENYRLYLSNLLKTISINWENIDDTIKRFQSGNQVIYSVSIAGYDLAYWYEDGKLITIHSMDELKQQRQKLSQLLNQPIVAAQFGYVREGD